MEEEAEEYLLEDVKKLAEENKKLKEEICWQRRNAKEWEVVMGVYTGIEEAEPDHVAKWIRNLLEENKKLKREMNSKLQDATLWENEDLETQARRWRMVAVGADEYAEKLKEEIEKLKEKLLNIQGACVGDGLEYLVEDK